MRLLALVASVTVLAPMVATYDMGRNDNLAVYWGQDAAGGQTDINTYCQDGTIDNIIISILDVFFGPGDEPEIDLANTCDGGSKGSYFPGTQLLDCSFMQSEIQVCQASGKLVTLALGGEIASVGFTSDAQAQGLADQIWNSFFGGFVPNAPRPFGNAVLDGIDLDIEAGTGAGYAAFVNRIRSHAQGYGKRIYITAAPQCPFPDATLGQVLNTVPFDAVYVQFYNNYCGLNNPNSYNFETWDKWAKSGSANPGIKVYIGALAGAGDPGYVDSGTLANYIKSAQKTYSSFGGVALWDASLAVVNGHYDVATKSSLTGGAVTPQKAKSGAA